MHEAPTPASSAVEDYLKAVYALESRLEGPVPTNALAERLGVTPGSVSGMLRRLDELGLLEHERYRGVTLTAEGRRVALRTLRNHRLLELLLVELLDVPWDRSTARPSCSSTCCPTSSPSGSRPSSATPSSIRTATRSRAATSTSPSARRARSTRSTSARRCAFVRVSDADPAMLRYLSERGIVPGDHAPVDRPPAVRRPADRAPRRRRPRARAGSSPRAMRVT